MSLRNITYLLFLTAVGTMICTNSEGQIINYGKPDPAGGVSVKQNPPPGESRIRVRDAFTTKTTTLKTTKGDPVFLLKISKSQTIGPFRYKPDSVVGKKDNPFSIVNISGDSFSLKSWKSNNTSGPYKFVDGEVMKTDSAIFVMVKKHAFLGGILQHPEFMTKKNNLYLLRTDKNIQNDLAQLKAQYVTLEYEHEFFKAPRKLEGPEIKTASGHIYPPYISRSKKDLSKDRRSTDAQARKYFQIFCRKNILKTITADPKGLYSFGKIPPGRYMVCCEGLKRNNDEDEYTRSKPTFWWTFITLEASDAVQLNLNDKNDTDWKNLFTGK